MTNHQPTRTLLSLVALVTFLASCSSVHAWTSNPAFTATQPSHTHTTRTQLSAWSIPVSMQSTKSYWYQDCGTAIERHIVYNDEDDWQDTQDGLGLAFARLDLMKDDATSFSNVQQSYDQSQQVGGSFPLRMVKGVWKRIRRAVA